MPGLPAAEQKGYIDAPVLIAGLEVDGVGFVEQVGVEHHRTGLLSRNDTWQVTWSTGRFSAFSGIFPYISAKIS